MQTYIELARKKADIPRFPEEHLDKMRGHQYFGGTDIRFKIIKSDFSCGAPGFGRVSEEDMSNFVAKRKALPMPVVFRIDPDQPFLFADDCRAGIVYGMKRDYLITK